MEHFIFHYTISGDYHHASQLRHDESFDLKEFFLLAREICTLEAQTFLNDANVIQLGQLHAGLDKIIKSFENSNPMMHFSANQWRLYVGLMCTFQEWCENVNFFELTNTQKLEILPENPVNWFYQNLR